MSDEPKPPPRCPYHTSPMVLTDNDATTGEIRQKFKCLVKDCSIEITRPLPPPLKTEH